MLVINLNSHPVQVQIDVAGGSDFIHLAAKGRGELSDGAYVNSNWLAVNPNIKVVADAVVTEPATPVQDSTISNSGAE